MAAGQLGVTDPDLGGLLHRTCTEPPRPDIGLFTHVAHFCLVCFCVGVSATVYPVQVAG